MVIHPVWSTADMPTESHIGSGRISADLADVLLANYVAARSCTMHNPNDVAVRAILTTIHRSLFDRQLTASRLKAFCGTADHNVATRFKLEVGCSIMSYVTRQRIEAAAECLVRTPLTVAAIARRTGFSSIQSFYVAFVRHYRTTPGAYARRVRQANAAKSSFIQDPHEEAL